jgi:hypothetical protein
MAAGPSEVESWNELKLTERAEKAAIEPPVFVEVQ